MKSNDKKILLIGPGHALQRLDRALFNEYTVIVYSEAIVHLMKEGLRPDYWTFIDPNSFFSARAKMIQDHLTLSLDTKILLPDIYTKYQEFVPGRYAFGSDNLDDSFTTRANLYEFSRLYTRYSYELLDSDIINVYPDQKYLDDVDFSKNLVLFRHGGTISASRNTDKFSCLLLPMVFYVFVNVEEILCLGFGEYNKPRITSLASGFKGYEEYKRSFDTIMPLIKREINNRSIKISFIEGNKSYYNALTTIGI